MKCINQECGEKAQYRERDDLVYCFKHWFQLADIIFRVWHERWVDGEDSNPDPLVFDRAKIIG